MLTHKNSKLGSRIWAWSLPVFKTCPGASAVCKAVCYADRGHLLMLNRRGFYESRLAVSRQTSFVSRIVSSVRANSVDVLRVHVSGDFYSADYVHKWRLIARRCRTTQFYAYTRSWADPSIRHALWQLGREPNFQLWLSTDRSMPRPPRWQGVRTCYLMTNDDDQPAYPVDLVFRDKTPSIMKRAANGSLVCPYDNGVTTTNCSQCKLCWRAQKSNGKPAAASLPLVSLSIDAAG